MRPSSESDSSAERGDPKVVHLGPLAAKALSASGNPNPARLERVLGQSVRFYLGPDRRDPGWAYPKFLELEDGAGTGQEVELDREAWDRLSAEAERQGIGAESLLQHAVLYFAAARDAGRLTSRILEVLEAEPAPSRRDDRGGS